MKYILKIVLIVGFIGCGFIGCGKVSDISHTADSGDDPLNSALRVIDETILREYVDQLTSKEFGGRMIGTEGNNKAAKYIADIFKAAGLKSYTSNYFQSFSSQEGKSQNVIGYLPGNDERLKKEAVILGAHYDHLGIEKEKLYPGADDNASGVAIMLETVKALMQVKSELRRSIVFIAFSGEEEQFLGSIHYIQNPVVSLENTVYMINFDMVGYLRRGELTFLCGRSSTKAEQLMYDISAKYPYIRPEATIDASEDGSDTVSFISSQIPSSHFFTGMHENYHKPSDTAEKLNYKGMSDITKIATELAWEISKLDKKPDFISTGKEIKSNFDHGVSSFKKTKHVQY